MISSNCLSNLLKNYSFTGFGRGCNQSTLTFANRTHQIDNTGGQFFGIKLQAQFGKVPLREILQAKDGLDYPLSEDDMTWQLEFYAG